MSSLCCILAAQKKAKYRDSLLDTSDIDFNRFLITSRVAGYDQEAFPHYTHFTVAELSSQQIEDFLPRWCRASIRRNRGAVTSTSGQSEQDEAIVKEAEQLAGNLSTALRNNQGVRGLAENPRDPASWPAGLQDAGNTQ